MMMKPLLPLLVLSIPLAGCQEGFHRLDRVVEADGSGQLSSSSPYPGSLASLPNGTELLLNAELELQGFNVEPVFTADGAAVGYSMSAEKVIVRRSELTEAATAIVQSLTERVVRSIQEGGGIASDVVTPVPSP